MNALDLLLVALMVIGGVGGWRLGLVSRAVSWAGMGLGLLIAARLLPRIVDNAADSTSRGQVFLIAALVLVGGAFGGQALGYAVSQRLTPREQSATARRVDSAGGAVAGVLGVLVAVWLLAPALADLDGWESRAVRSSRVVRAVTDVFPDPPDATRTLRRLLGDQYPQVFDALQPTPELGPPPASSGISQATADRVSTSVLKVVGEACNRIQEGTGFVAEPGLVVTNAHVVAGESTTVVQTSEGQRLTATVVAFDPRRDLAVLAVDDLSAPALPIGGAEVGDRGAVFGHPGGGPLELSPFVVGERVNATGSDIYGEERTERDVLVLSAELAPGDSGSALVDPDGEVVGVAFATAPDRDGVAYALAIPELEAVLAEVGATAADTGSCIG